ncbi:uncharacterized protein FIESC28_08226 [Fusarium coffeatum]|uniref:Uncharacterized protein n=1 Tax=Fusarium coffeatum TaxID=231269 RepID=A0A366R910_9HYPO|nr:uncharacterized protein FIESC28_08226 [Fusarium coffeatum]RBR13362.1 hypothetical protein FIESC28_08226 [Fusarium coffeatum]
MVSSEIPRASLLGLPSEFRNQIYQNYSTVDGGYVYDGDTNKLVQPGGKPIDISLRSACRSIALETQDFLFSLNNIKFSTVYRKDWQKQAITPDMYHSSSVDLGKHMAAVKAEVEKCIAIDARCPEMRYTFGCLRSRDDIDDLRATSGCNSNSYLLDQAVSQVLRAFAGRYPEEFAAAVDLGKPGWSSSHSALDFFDLTFPPWATPSLAEATALAEEWNLVKEGDDQIPNWYQKTYLDTAYRGPIFKYRRRRHFSAASLAIRFLNQITKRQRLCIRHLIINEDRLSGPRPECHPLGLIPFCRENPKLYIDHRVNLWRSFIMRTCGHSPSPGQVAHSAETVVDEEDEEFHMGSHQVFTSSVIQGFVDWLVVHTTEILDEGMSLASYTLTLDGDPDLNYSTEMFNTIMKPMIAGLTMNSDIVARGIFTAPDHPDYPFMTRRSMTEITPVDKRSSVLQCNFTLDQPWSYKNIIKEEEIEPGEVESHRALNPVGRDSCWFDICTPLVHILDITLEYFDREKLVDCTDEMLSKYGNLSGKKTIDDVELWQAVAWN